MRSERGSLRDLVPWVPWVPGPGVQRARPVGLWEKGAAAKAAKLLRGDLGARGSACPRLLPPPPPPPVQALHAELGGGSVQMTGWERGGCWESRAGLAQLSHRRQAGLREVR